MGWYVLGDKYLKSTADNKLVLAYDIYENGTYWPLLVKRIIGKENRYELRDGVHRFYCMRKLIELGIWSSDKRVLVITDDLQQDYDCEIIRDFTVPCMVNDSFKDVFSFIYAEFDKCESIDYVDDNQYFAYFRTKEASMRFVSCYSILLRNAFYDYKQENGYAYPTSPIINDERCWNDWKSLDRPI